VAGREQLGRQFHDRTLGSAEPARGSRAVPPPAGHRRTANQRGQTISRSADDRDGPALTWTPSIASAAPQYISGVALALADTLVDHIDN
jgi:hypothetical protein